MMDMTGRPVPLASTGRRVALFPPLLADFLTLDREPSHVLAAALYDIRNVNRGPLGRIFPTAVGILPAATQGNSAIPAGPEQLLALHPDAIFSWAWFADSLLDARLPVIEMTDDGSHPLKNESDWWRVLAEVDGTLPRERALFAASDRRERELRVELATGSPQRRPSAVYLVISEFGDMRIAAVDSLESTALTRAGARAVHSSAEFGAAGIETLLQLDPDVLFVDAHFGGHASARWYYQAPGFSSLSAARTRRIYVVPDDGTGFNGPIGRPILERWMAELLHPDRLSKSTRMKLTEVYGTVYGYRLTEQEIDTTLRLEENRGSVSYERFE